MSTIETVKVLARSRFVLAAVTAMATAVAVGGIGWASIPDGSGVIHGCYESGSTNHDLTVIDNAVTAHCPPGYTGLDWNQGAPETDLSRVATLNWYGGAYGGGSYGFDEPYAVAFDGTHMWVANYAGNSVTEMNAATGAWVQTLSGRPLSLIHI